MPRLRRPPRRPKWSEWSDDLFARAAAEQRFVILDLEAVWCHWCHVMEKTTYANPEVKELLAAKYLPVRVDQDANPDLSSRYGDWGWPATIVFGPDGTEIAKIRAISSPSGCRRCSRPSSTIPRRDPRSARPSRSSRRPRRFSARSSARR